MGQKYVALAASPGAGVDASGLRVDRTVIASQSTPTAIKTGAGNIYGVYALVSGNAATSGVFIQYFDHGGVTLGVSTPTFELNVPWATTTMNASSAAWNFPIGIPIGTTNATTSGIWIAAGIAASTGAAVAANTVTIYTLYA